MSKTQKRIFGILVVVVGFIGLGIGLYGYKQGWWKMGSDSDSTNTQTPTATSLTTTITKGKKSTWGTVYGQDGQQEGDTPSSPSGSSSTSTTPSSTPSSGSSSTSATPSSASSSSASPSTSPTQQQQQQAPPPPPSGALGEACNADGSCDDGLWCKTSDKRCYQRCTKTKNMCTPSLVPRKNTYECDYDAPMCSADAGKIGQVCGPNNTCQGNAECKNGRCYERCGASGSCTSETMPRKNTYWCNPTAPQCNAGRPTAPSILSSTPALTTGGPPAYPAQMGNNTNYLVYKNYKWDGYACSYLDKYFPYDIGALDGRIVGRVNQDPQGKLYAMRATCVDSTGNMQGHLVAAPGWMAYQNTSCTTCVGTQAYEDTQKANAMQAYLNAPCHQCPPGWLPDGTKCSPGNNTRQSLLDKNMPADSISVATIKQLFPQLQWTTCPDTYMGAAEVCKQCPPGWKVNSSGHTCDALNTNAYGLQAYNANTNQQSGFIPKNVGTDQLVAAGVTWDGSCNPRARPTAASNRTQQLWGQKTLTANQINQLRGIPLSDWQIRNIQQMWNGERHYLLRVCIQPEMFEQLIGVPGSPSMKMPPTPLPDNIRNQYKRICQIANLLPNTVFSDWNSAKAGLEQLQLRPDQIAAIKHYYDSGQMHAWCENPDSYFASNANLVYGGLPLSDVITPDIFAQVCNAL